MYEQSMTSSAGSDQLSAESDALINEAWEHQFLAITPLALLSGVMSAKASLCSFGGPSTNGPTVLG
jgi:hypothetical protein